MSGFNVSVLLNVPSAPGAAQGGIYRPSQWSTQSSSYSGLVSINDGSTIWIFDAILSQDHNQSAQITEHPVQTGANISDHAYMQPARLTLEIAMSDAMDMYTAGQFTEGAKSVSAYLALKTMCKNRQPLTIMTRLDTYANMLIENMHAIEDYKTLYGLKCPVYFRQIMIGQINTQPSSTQPQVTNSNNLGTQQSTSPTSSQSSILSGLDSYL